MAQNPCDVGCIGEYAGGVPIALPVVGTNIAPFVEATLTVGNGEIVISCGNESAPTLENHAVIKSFEYSYTDGFWIKMDIQDEQGTALEKAIQSLAKCPGEGSQISITFGWVDTDCNGRKTILQRSNKITGQPAFLESSVSSGRITVKLEISDSTQEVASTSVDLTYGSDDHPINLKNAIRQLFRDERCPPVIQSVKFLRRTSEGGFVGNNAGGVEEWKFDGMPDGPIKTWSAKAQNKIITAYEWLKNFITDNQLGVYITSDPNSQVPGVILWEDARSNKQQVPWEQLSLGTYVVNGGVCSPVIDFSPSVQWKYAFQQQEGTGGGTGMGTAEIERKDGGGEGIGKRGLGNRTSVPLDNNAINAHGFKEASKKSNEADYKYEMANRNATFSASPVTADLVIQGNATFSYLGPQSTFGRCVGIVVINPFHVTGQQNAGTIFNPNGDLVPQEGSCGEWLAQPGCNQFFSNNAWRIMGVTHVIKSGSYTTTLSVLLDGPGSTTDKGSPLGGFGAKGPSAALLRNICE